MKKEPMLYGIIGLLAGVLIAGGAAALAVNNNNQGMMRMMGMNTSRMKNDSVGHMGMSMNDMGNALRDKTGDEFDKLFLEMMIDHHVGAISMATLAKTNAKHQEVKDLATDILSAQSKEIDQMRAWQANWAYPATPQTEMMH